MSNIYENKPPIINGDGKQTRDFVYVGDVVNANILAMESTIKHGFINIGTGHSMTILELAKMIIEVSGLALSPTHRSALEGDIKESVADASLARELLRWMPKVNLYDWLKVAIPAKIN